MSRSYRLAAIMFTDIQGYTKLMQDDEDSEMQIRNRHRKIFQFETKKHHGEIIQYYGDGTLSIFESCVDAVRCAKEIQKQYQSDPVIPVRIGIHLGDIRLSDEDIVGDSVNVASRVESLGVSGSVLISKKVYEEIRNKQEFDVQELGEFHFKNDHAPRMIYAVKGENLVIPRKEQLQGKLEKKKAPKLQKWILRGMMTAVIIAVSGYFFLRQAGIFNQPIRSLAVLPLYDRVGLKDSEDYILEGLHEEIITKLTKAGLDVKPYSAMVHYRDNPKTPSEIGEELNVDGVVEGSLFRTADIYRIRVQVIDIDEEAYISEPYEAESAFSEIMNLYEDLVGTIAEQIKYKLSDEVQTYLAQNQSVDPKAYDLYLKGRYYLNIGSSDDVEKAIEYYKQALVADSTLVDAHIALVESYLLLGFSSQNPGLELSKFRYHLSKAMEKDPFLSRDHHLMGMAKIFDNWDWKGASEEIEKAMANAPDAWEPFDSYCQLMWAMGNMEESISAGKMAVKNDPAAHFAQCDLSWAYYLAGDYDKARSETMKTINRFGRDCPHHMGLSFLVEIAQKMESGESLVNTIERIERAIDTNENLLVFNESLLGYAHALEGNEDIARALVHRLEERGISGTDKIYIALGEFGKAIQILEEAISNRSLIQMFVIKKAPWLDPLRGEPEFDRILHRIGLADQQLQGR